MKSQQQCPKCGGAIAAGLPEGQCPTCLLAMARINPADKDDSLPAVGKTSLYLGDYQLVRQLGGGGMGIVYEAIDRLNRRVAIKLIRDWQLASPILLRRFHIEAKAAARLDHPCIVPIFDSREVDGQPFIIMGLVEGESLAQIIARDGFGVKRKREVDNHPPWRERQAAIAKLMVKIALAVEHAHQRGVIHRDLKPANVLMDAAGEPHLTDFGLAKLMALEEQAQLPSLTNPEDLLGTPNYMSPEQATHGGATKASDIHGLGAVMYALLTGRPPFAGKTALETVKQAAELRPTNPKVINPQVELDLDTICMKCLEKNPLRRYPSADAMAVDLKLWLENRPILSRPVGPLVRTGQWAKRNPVGTALILSLCLGLSVSVGMLIRIHKMNRQKSQLIEEMAAAAMQKIDQIYSTNKTVSISSRELAALFGRPILDAQPVHEWSLGVRVGMEPSSTAHKYAERLGLLETAMRRELGKPVAFHLRLFQAGDTAEEMLAHGKADLLLMNAVEFAQISARHPELIPLARKKNTKCLVFVPANSEVRSLEMLRGHSVAFPNPSWYMNVQAKALLARHGIYRKDLIAWTNFVDEVSDTGRIIDSRQETMLQVFKRHYTAGVTSRKEYEASTYYHPTSPGLREIAAYEAPGELYVLRAAAGKSDQEQFQALQKACISALEMKPADKLFLDDLGDAIRQAHRFDGDQAEPATGAKPTGE